ncbi:MAG: hypothetical protein ACYTFN_23925 [Planctomycetota bacterium]|jgi:hypothetical protein
MHPTVLEQFPISRGAHESRDDGLCAMEMVAWLAGEEHSDDPRCACPVIASYVRALNDCLPSNADRERHLRRLLPQLVNTRSHLQLRRRRAFRVADHGARVLAAMFFEARGDREAAARMRALAPIQNRARAQAAHDLARELDAPRTVYWPLMMAARNHAAVTWIPVVVQLVSEIGSEAGYEAAAQLVCELVETSIQASTPTSDKTSDKTSDRASSQTSPKIEKPFRRRRRRRRHFGRLSS